MSIELTEPQQRALDEEQGVLVVVDPRNNERYRLVRDEDFVRAQDELDDEVLRKAISRIGTRNVAKRMLEES